METMDLSSPSALDLPISGFESQATDSATLSTASLRQTELNFSGTFSLPPLLLSAPEPTVILGDQELCGLKLEQRSTVLASRKGRLSFFKERLHSMSSVHETVTVFVICLSTLDAGNKVSTNFCSLRNLLYNARRIFPNAQLGVLQGFRSSALTAENRQSMEDLLTMISERQPAGCVLLPSLPSTTEEDEDTEPEPLHAWIQLLLDNFL